MKERELLHVFSMCATWNITLSTFYPHWSHVVINKHVSDNSLTVVQHKTVRLTCGLSRGLTQYFHTDRKTLGRPLHQKLVLAITRVLTEHWIGLLIKKCLCKLDCLSITDILLSVAAIIKVGIDGIDLLCQVTIQW